MCLDGAAHSLAAANELLCRGEERQGGRGTEVGPHLGYHRCHGEVRTDDSPQSKLRLLTCHLRPVEALKQFHLANQKEAEGGGVNLLLTLVATEIQVSESRYGISEEGTHIYQALETVPTDVKALELGETLGMGRGGEGRGWEGKGGEGRGMEERGGKGRGREEREGEGRGGRGGGRGERGYGGGE